MFKIGKEYELGVYLGSSFCTNDRKTTDGSGPSEISSPVFESFLEAIYFENLLHRIYGDILYDYYRDRDGDEQKGNHFHYSLQDYFYEFYVFNTNFIQGKYNKLLTLHDNWRNTFGRWVEQPFVECSEDEFYDYNNREYAFLTPNRQHKDALTVEVRASEGSVVGDICWLTIIAGEFSPDNYYEFSEYYNYEIGGTIDGEAKELDFSWIKDTKQQKEFKVIQQKLLIPYVDDNFNRFELRDRGFQLAEIELSKQEKERVKKLLLETLL